MRTFLTLSVLSLFFAALPVTAAHAYVGRRIIYAPTSTIYDRAKTVSGNVYRTTRCVYHDSNGNCQYVTNHYNNVRTTNYDLRTRSYEQYLYVEPTTVSPRAPDHKRPFYERWDGYYYTPVVPSYDTHYRRMVPFNVPVYQYDNY